LLKQTTFSSSSIVLWRMSEAVKSLHESRRSFTAYSSATPGGNNPIKPFLGVRGDAIEEELEDVLTIVAGGA
jgi:hypothetical protein